MRTIAADRALESFVAPGDRVLLGTAAGAAITLQSRLGDQRERLDGLRLCGGLQLGGYDFMEPVREGRWSYDTWHVTRRIRDDIADRRVGFHLVRGGAVPDLVRRLWPDVFLTTVSPPDRDGNVSLGVSVSYALPALDHVPTVVAEVQPEMPVVRGDTHVPASRFAALVEAEQPLPTHRPRASTPEDAEIAGRIRGLVPEDATVQIGLGGVPEALVDQWVGDPPPGLRLFGMGVDGMVDLLPELGRPGSFVGGELLGTERLYRFAHDNALVEQYPIGAILAVPRLAAIPRFVSINSALEVDLTGQVNAEWAVGRQISGPGGGFDYLDGATLSEGGLSIVALRSRGGDAGASSIVARLGADVPVTVPRHAVQVVVTEHGVADLRGLTLEERAEALIAIAAPEHRSELEGRGR